MWGRSLGALDKQINARYTFIACAQFTGRPGWLGPMAVFTYFAAIAARAAASCRFAKQQQQQQLKLVLSLPDF